MCCAPGNDNFTWFATTGSKSRLNFLDLLRAGHTDYVINDAALTYMRERALSGPVIARLAEHPHKQFADPVAWQAHLARLGITALTVTPDPIQIATEGALWGSIHAHDFLREGGLSAMTPASSPSVGTHSAGCTPSGWCTSSILLPTTSVVAQKHVRSLIWRFYADLKAYRANPTLRRRGQLRVRFDRIFCRRTGFVTLDRL
jgi:hypothetical protein